MPTLVKYVRDYYWRNQHGNCGLPKLEFPADGGCLEYREVNNDG